MSQAGTAGSGGGGASGITTINGDTSGTGASTTPTVTVNASANPGTIEFNGNGSSTLTLQLTDSNNNTSLGRSSLNNAISGSTNNIHGADSGTFISTGSANNAIGYGTYQNLTTGSNNTCAGNAALINLGTGSNNLALGCYSTTLGSGRNYSGAESNNIAIMNAGVAAESDTTRIGTSQTRAFVAGIRGVTTANADAVPVLIDSAGQLGTVSSSRRYKSEIHNISSDVAYKILDLCPVEFEYNEQPGIKRVGLIAEDVQTSLPQLVIYNEEMQPETVRYQDIPIYMLAQMKEMEKTIVNLQRQICDLQKRMSEKCD